MVGSNLKMKKHKFVKSSLIFGSEILRCIYCDAISLDVEQNPYCSEEDWRSVSQDCSLAFKQIELYSREKN